MFVIGIKIHYNRQIFWGSKCIQNLWVASTVQSHILIYPPFYRIAYISTIKTVFQTFTCFIVGIFSKNLQGMIDAIYETNIKKVPQAVVSFFLDAAPFLGYSINF